jgi:hypothetical protein
VSELLGSLKIYEFRKGADWLASKLKVAFVSVNDTDCEIWCQRRRQRRRQRRQ